MSLSIGPPTMLPVELIDHILSFLRGDPASLNSCLNGHPLLSRLAEPYYYADIVIIVTQDNFAVSSFYENISQNPHILGYLRTLEIRAHSHLVSPPLLTQDSRMLLGIISMIPRMTNLTLLKLGDILFGGSLYGGNDFYTAFQTSLQHSSVEQLCLDRFLCVKLSVLDNCKNIKKLTLSYCRGLVEPVSISPYHLLETLVIRSPRDISLFVGMTSRVPNLKSLQLRGVLTKGFDWNRFPELLEACSSSLTELHIDVGDRGSTHVSDSTNGNWIGDDLLEFPFTLSRHKSLKRLSIVALVFSSNNTTTRFALPAIMKLIKTAPLIQDVVLRLHWMSTNTNPLRRLDWSPLIQLQSGFPTTCPRIHLHISIGSTRPDTILDALAENEPLMSLVKRGVVIFKPLADGPVFF